MSKEPGLRVLLVRVSGVRGFDYRRESINVSNLNCRNRNSNSNKLVITMNYSQTIVHVVLMQKKHSSRGSKKYSSREYSLLLNSS